MPEDTWHSFRACDTGGQESKDVISANGTPSSWGVCVSFVCTVEIGKSTPLNDRTLLSLWGFGYQATVCGFETISFPISLQLGDASCCVEVSLPSFDLQQQLYKALCLATNSTSRREARAVFAQEFCAWNLLAPENLGTKSCLYSKASSVTKTLS